MSVNSKKIPEICLPLTGKTRQEIEAQLEVIIPNNPDIIELRADFLKEIANGSDVISIVNMITEKTTIPLMFTIRSEREGGQAISLDQEGIVALLGEVAKETQVSMIDFEVHNTIEHIQKVVEITHKYDKQVIMSYHNFTETPDDNTLMGYFIQMELFRADIAKIAVMPENKADVLRLLALTSEADERISIPVVTMSMGELGKISRVLGWVHGSVMTFGIGAASSAPGQIQVKELRKAIETVQSLSGDW